MPVQLTKHGFPVQPNAEPEGGGVINDLTLGLHKGRPPAHLPPGYTPDALNFIPKRNGIQLRDGLASFRSFSLPSNEATHGGLEVTGANGERFSFQFGQTQVAFGDPNLASYWTTLTNAGGNPLSGTTQNYFQSTPIVDLDTETIVIFTNGFDFPQFAIAESGTTQYSDFTWLNDSFDTLDTVQVVATVNDRLIAANITSSSDTVFPNRIIYSQRANPRELAPSAAAGFFDLASMQGPITAIAELEDHAYVFSEQEIWRMQATFDDEAFRSAKLVGRIGTKFHRTIVETPLGMMFLGADYEIYLIATGGTLERISKEPGGTESRIRNYLRRNIEEAFRAWSVYDSMDHMYKLFFPTFGSFSGYPQRAFFVNLDDLGIWEQEFRVALSHGFPFTDPDDIVPYDQLIGIPYQDLLQTYDSLRGEGEGLGFAVFGIPPGRSATSMYQFSPGAPTDDGAVFDNHWQSSDLGSRDPERYDILSGAWVEYNAISDSSLTVRLSPDAGRSFGQERRFATIQNDYESVFMPTRLNSEAPVLELQAGAGININRIVSKRRLGGRKR